MEPSDNNNKTPLTQLRMEISAVIHRYAQESDITVYGVVGALESIKADLLNKLKEAQDE